MAWNQRWTSSTNWKVCEKKIWYNIHSQLLKQYFDYQLIACLFYAGSAEVKGFELKGMRMDEVLNITDSK